MFGEKKKQSMLIFVVEDNAVYAKSLELYLKKQFPAPAEVKVYPVGELAIDNLKLEPDYIVMDYQLDSKYYDASDGLTTIREIRAKRPDVRIIVLSQQKDVSIPVEAADLGCRYVMKNEQAFESVEKLIRNWK